MTYKTIALGIAAIGLACAPLSAQLWLRDNDQCIVPYVIAGEHGSISAKATTLKWTIYDNIGTPVTTTLPFNRPGSITDLGGKRFLVSGINVDDTVSPAVAGDGVVMLVELLDSPRSINVVARQSFPGRDFEETYFNAGEQLLYAYDRVQEEVVFGAVGSPLGIPPIFFPIENVNGQSFLTRRNAPTLYPTASGLGVRVGSTSTLEQEVVALEFVFLGAGWATVPISDHSSAQGWKFWQFSENARGPTVGVIGATGSFAIALAGGADVVNGASLNPSTRVDVPVAAGSLTPGATYYVRSTQSGVGDSPFQTINSVWGSKCDSANLTLQRDLTHGLYVGNQDFTVSSRVMWVDPTDEAVATRSCYLIVGFDIPVFGGVTVNTTTNCASINNAFAIVGPLSVEIRGKNQGHMTVALPVPSDPGLAGLHMVFQWAAEDGSELALSEVYGSLIFPAPVAAAMAASGGSGSSPNHHCGTKWFSGLPKCVWNASKTALKQRVETLNQ